MPERPVAAGDDLAIVAGTPVVEAGDGERPLTAEILDAFADLRASASRAPELATPESLAGLRAASSPEVIIHFVDPTPADVQATAHWAADQWAGALDLDPAVPLEISFGWRQLDPGLLGYAGPSRYVASSSLPPGYHPVGLANRLLGRDTLGSEVDIVVVINSTEAWNIDVSSMPSSSQSDLGSTLLHELGHGLGFVSSATWRNGVFDTSDPILFSYDRILEAGTTPFLSLSGPARRNALVSSNAWVGLGDGRRWPVWAPAQPSAGSSIGHFDESRVPHGSPGSMMTPMQQRGTTERVIDAPVLGVLAGLGWPLDAPLSPPTSLAASVSGPQVTVTWTIDDHAVAVPAQQFRARLRDANGVVASIDVVGSARSATLSSAGASGTLSAELVPLGYGRQGAVVSRAIGSSPSATASGLDLDVAAQPLRDQVRRLYLAYFGREADAGGLTHWMRQRAQGSSVGDVSSAFAASSEFRATYGSLSDGAFVDLVYQNVMGRAADGGGRSYWIGKLAAGTTRGDVMAAFSDSPEYLGRTATSPVEPVHHSQIRRLYEAYFGRKPDAGGMRYWIGQIELGRTLAEVSETFAGSVEFRGLYGNLDDAAFVDLVYGNVLDRAPDAGGREHWRSRLAGGLGRGSMMLAFSESIENVVRTGTLP